MNILKQIIDEQVPQEIKTQVREKGYVVVASWLNESQPVDNPEPQQEIQITPDIGMMSTLIPLNEQATSVPAVVAQLNSAKALAEAMGGSFHRTPQQLMTMLVEAGLSEATQKKLEAYLAETVPDPNWQAQIADEARWQALGLSAPVTVEAVQDALNVEAE